jgi:hypothetical protein
MLRLDIAILDYARRVRPSAQALKCVWCDEPYLIGIDKGSCHCAWAALLA